MSYRDGDEWLDGPKVDAWLRARIEGYPGAINKATVRRSYDWRRGARVSVYRVDEILAKHLPGFHITDLPDDFWDVEQKLASGHRGVCMVRRVAVSTGEGR